MESTLGPRPTFSPRRCHSDGAPSERFEWLMAPTAAMCSAQLRAFAARLLLTPRPGRPFEARRALVRAMKSPSAPGSLTAPAGDDRTAMDPATTIATAKPQ